MEAETMQSAGLARIRIPWDDMDWPIRNASPAHIQKRNAHSQDICILRKGKDCGMVKKRRAG
jgi:hypothetical protein